MSSSKKVKTSISVDGHLMEKLKELAKIERRSVSQMISLSIEELVAELEDDENSNGSID